MNFSYLTEAQKKQMQADAHWKKISDLIDKKAGETRSRSYIRKQLKIGMREVDESLISEEADSWAKNSQEKQHSGSLASQDVQHMRLLDDLRSEIN